MTLIKTKVIIITLLILIFITACSADNSAIKNDDPKTKEDRYDSMVLAQDDETLTILDARGNKVTIKKKPKRVIPMQITLLELWYLSGGEAVARTSAKSNIPEQALNLPEVGTTTIPNIELLLAVQPDLVILNSTSDSHVEMAPILEENNISYFYTGTSLNPYESIMETLYLFSTITEDDEAFEQNAIQIEKGVNQVIAKTKGKKSPTVLILFGSSRTVRCELKNGLVGDMCNRLGAKNVIDFEIKGESKIDFSLETVIEHDPDYILISVMGDLDKVKNKISKDIESNEAWRSLTAVKEGRVYYLPPDLYMYKPNERYPEAFEGLYDILYSRE